MYKCQFLLLVHKKTTMWILKDLSSHCRISYKMYLTPTNSILYCKLHLCTRHYCHTDHIPVSRMYHSNYLCTSLRGIRYCNCTIRHISHRHYQMRRLNLV